MKLSSKTLLIKHTPSYHLWAGDKCSSCNKTTEELFWELIWKYEDEEALRYMYQIQTLGHHFHEYDRDKIVVSRHTYCLTPEESMIKDIIE